MFVFVLTNLFVYYSGYDDLSDALKKPVIYLYPQQTQAVTVRLDLDGELTTTYPQISGNTWNVIAHSDGTLIDQQDGRQHKYLFWEGFSPLRTDFSTGFVVAGTDSLQFLQTTLAELGLTDLEANEFITYWLPHLEQNPYNLIHFAGSEYTDVAQLTVSPTPDSVLRVFMVYKPLNKPITIQEQTLPQFNRHGFSVVEWGGMEMTD